MLTLGGGNVNNGSVGLENIDFLDTLDVGKGHLLKDATQLLIIYSADQLYSTLLN